ncbi:MAG: esterase-like activity of phytase family protein [Rhizobiaceae bacterium]|nr:esterase-like activity of phytase family protein [Rhizobiaceae bacterium]
MVNGVKRGRAGGRRISHWVASLALLALLAPAGVQAADEAISVNVRPISQFRIGSDETRFGPLEFVGGLEMTSSSRDFGALSSFRFLTPGADFIGVADTGFWFFGTLGHDADGRPATISDFSMEQMVDAAGNPIDEKWEVDGEGLDVKDGIATVGFERRHRVAQFRIERGAMKPAFKELDFLVPRHELRQNKGFETVTRAHPYGQHENGLVVVSERSIDTQGNVFAAIIEGPNKGVFTVKRDGNFDITDGAFLENGDLLILERSFSVAEGVRMRLRRLYGETIAKGQVADGPVLFAADMAYQIDNMEGMDVWKRADGKTIVSLVSDDNHSILQRNLYLEFILNDE